MTGSKSQDGDRAERLAAELRANLKKRKAQARAKAQQSKTGNRDAPQPAVEKPRSSG